MGSNRTANSIHVAPLIKVPREIPPKLFVPNGQQIAIHVYEAESETDGGLILPDNAKDKWTTPIALVISAGPKCEQVKDGDKILVHPSTKGTTVRYGGKEWVLIHESNVCGVLEKS